jgi:hypothetical protein
LPPGSQLLKENSRLNSRSAAVVSITYLAKDIYLDRDVAVVFRCVLCAHWELSAR